MINALDSRALRYADCYGQRFMKAGAYHYNILPIGGDLVTADRPFVIQVAEPAKPHPMKQHAVNVLFEGGKFTIDTKTLAIDAGDLVMWNCRNTKALPYLVVGDKEFFGSHRLFNECGYTHAFGSAGEYRWKDAFGSNVAGVVRVKDPDCRDAASFKKWQQSLSKGTIVMINDGKVDPKEVDVVVGQTVFFAVTKAAGISITEEGLIAPNPGRYGSP